MQHQFDFTNKTYNWIRDIIFIISPRRCSKMEQSDQTRSFSELKGYFHYVKLAFFYNFSRGRRERIHTRDT